MRVQPPLPMSLAARGHHNTVLVRAEGEQERDVERDPGRGPLGIEAGAELVEPRLGQQQDERASKAHASACTRRR